MGLTGQTAKEQSLDRSLSEIQITAFQRELDHRLQSLDRGEHADPSAVRRRIEKKSQARRRGNP